VWRAWGAEKLDNWALNYFTWGMAKPLRLPGVEEQRMLEELEIELLVKPAQQARWNRVLSENSSMHIFKPPHDNNDAGFHPDACGI
jgi:hypothetical protein